MKTCKPYFFPLLLVCVSTVVAHTATRENPEPGQAETPPCIVQGDNVFDTDATAANVLSVSHADRTSLPRCAVVVLEDIFV